MGRDQTKRNPSSSVFQFGVSFMGRRLFDARQSHQQHGEQKKRRRSTVHHGRTEQVQQTAHRRPQDHRDMKAR